MKNELAKRIAGGIDNGIEAKVHKFDRRVSLEAGIKMGVKRVYEFARV